VDDQCAMATKSRSKRGRAVETSLLVQPKYSNALPDVPFAPKFLEYPFDPNRFVTYNHTRLEKTHKFQLHVPSDLGVEVDLIDGITLGNPEAVDLDPRDEALLKDAANLSEREKKRAKTRGQDLKWMRKTIYMNGQGGRTYGKQTETSTENKVLGRRMSELDVADSSKETQVRTIEEQFEDAKPANVEKLTHPTKKGVHVVESIPIFPDFDHWQFQFYQGVFDSNPMPPKSDKQPAGFEAQYLAQSVLHADEDEEGMEPGFFWPTEATMLKRKRRREGEEREIEVDEMYEFRRLRKYNFNIDTTPKDVYYFAQREDATGQKVLYYNQLTSKVQLSRRRMNKEEREAKELAQNRGEKVAKTEQFLTVKHRAYETSELDAQAERLRELDYQDNTGEGEGEGEGEDEGEGEGDSE